MAENEAQKMIRLAWMTFGWRILYARDVELQVAHGRMTRNVLSPEFFEAWKDRMLKEVEADCKKLNTLGVVETQEFESRVRQTLDETKWKPFADKIEAIQKWMRTLYPKYGDKPEAGQRVVNRFTDTNRLRWTRKQYDHFVNDVSPTFKRMSAAFKPSSSIEAIKKDAKYLLDAFKTGGVLAYPGLDRLFKDLVDSLSQIETSGATTLNAAQAKILSTLYKTKIYPRLYMMWQFSRQSKPNS